MAFRIELCAAGFLLLLSVLHTSQSAHIAAVQMADLGKDALTHLENVAQRAMRNHSGSHSVGCIEEAKEHEHLNCSLVSTFSSYFNESINLKGHGKKMVDKLKAIMETVDGLKKSKCKGHVTTCEAAFQEAHTNLEKLRSLLVLYQKWIVKPMQ